jgi:hypothetical protein
MKRREFVTFLGCAASVAVAKADVNSKVQPPSGRSAGAGRIAPAFSWRTYSITSSALARNESAALQIPSDLASWPAVGT